MIENVFFILQPLNFIFHIVALDFKLLVHYIYIQFTFDIIISSIDSDNSEYSYACTSFPWFYFKIEDCINICYNRINHRYF